MKQTIICLFMALSLLAAPIAHAAGLVCADEAGKTVELSNVKKAVSGESKQSKEVAQQCAHCAGCSHSIADRTAAKIAEPIRESSTLVIATEVDKLTSLSVGPPSEPPLHA